MELREAPEPRRGTYKVVAVFKGTGRARVLMLTHYDTVFPAGEAARRPLRREGDMAYGPGVADMQSSIALLIAAVEILHNKLGQRNYDTLTIHCNADEETVPTAAAPLSGNWGAPIMCPTTWSKAAGKAS